MSKKTLFIGLGVAILGIGWYAFRPELLFVDQTVNETLPAASAMTQTQTLASGNFHGVAHKTSGMATVLQSADGKRVLRLTNFETSNGPDVRVLLIGANDASDNATVSNSNPIEIAKLKGNKGDQNYELPANLDLNKYRAVTIWCNRFHVNFATAPLTNGMAQAPASTQPQALAMGDFRGVAHKTSGTATIYQLADGKRVLRLTNFETSNGPDVRILLIAANDAKDNAMVKNSAPIEIAKLKGNKGDQNYELPARLDLNRYKAVTIWCNRFSVNFGTAPLKQGI